ncbi:hypothetical protein Slin15195_G122820 [Septoria linicola]|uniref:Uncharacterized protein n=1 Tax=Septoria linicola TaxID=215465 RepID=A0A9Q9B7R9_9PEZI|nr:hypothetical protein Slin14017_G079020 [Septoria linicola]USW58963.1 hypothetical protein Slin15195_G122820 [Septoria linicola]
MMTSTIVAALGTAATAQVIPNRIYIATSSSSALVNQWAVIGEPGARLGWSKDASLASNLTVIQDDRYIDPEHNPSGLILADDSSTFYAFSSFDSDSQFPKDDVNLNTVRFSEPMTLLGDAGTAVLPMVNNVVKSLEVRNHFLDIFQTPPQEKAIDVMQICGDGQEGGVPYYLIVADGYVNECANVTLRYV